MRPRSFARSASASSPSISLRSLPHRRARPRVQPLAGIAAGRDAGEVDGAHVLGRRGEQVGQVHHALGIRHAGLDAVEHERPSVSVRAQLRGRRPRDERGSRRHGGLFSHLAEQRGHAESLGGGVRVREQHGGALRISRLGAPLEQARVRERGTRPVDRRVEPNMRRERGLEVRRRRIQATERDGQHAEIALDRPQADRGSDHGGRSRVRTQQLVQMPRAVGVVDPVRHLREIHHRRKPVPVARQLGEALGSRAPPDHARRPHARRPRSGGTPAHTATTGGRRVLLPGARSAAPARRRDPALDARGRAGSRRTPARSGCREPARARTLRPRAARRRRSVRRARRARLARSGPTSARTAGASPRHGER